MQNQGVSHLRSCPARLPSQHHPMRNVDPRILRDSEQAEEGGSGGIHASTWRAAAAGDLGIEREHLV